MGQEEHSNRIIRLTEAAQYDLSGIDNATAATWGEDQADRYLAFLTETLTILADNPKLGIDVEEFPGIRVFTAKVSKRRNAYGHRIFFREIEGGIRVIRILHTAMNWPAQIRPNLN